MKKDYFRELILSIQWLKALYLKYRIKNSKDLMTLSELNVYLEEAEKVYLDSLKLPHNFKVGLVRDDDTYVKDRLYKKRAYYPKYERFLKNNNIEYEYYDPYRSDWIEKAKQYSLIVWQTESDPSTQDIAEGKIYILEKMNIKCLPTFEEIWSFENKVHASYLYQLHNLPSIPTFITHSKEEAIDYIINAKFPLVSKIKTGSSSYGVDKLKDKRDALKLIAQAFSYKGKSTYFPYINQKNYIYFQKFIADSYYDLRVMCVGEDFFGYYRYPNKGDFRASGAGNYEKKEIPSEALELAYKVKKLFNATFLATDFVYSEIEQRFLIIESSIFIGIDTCEQLSIDGISGKYIRNSENDYTFVSGKYWIQELALKAKCNEMFDE
ncbi:hypothetical protein QR665_15220 [Acinetobacter gerneri]|uniref:ATP-grasp domain-containing protein n=1 Tax=Acinetobacter gerneri TaxID=202952 RepID=UPI00293641B1|nr:hypothetical protein [Acinetobacter gerneri]MDV2440811.1 hypothetical protein [Acinetobacter gerneri]